MPWLQEWDAHIEAGWAVVGVAVEGRGVPVLLARGCRTPQRFSTIAL